MAKKTNKKSHTGLPVVRVKAYNRAVNLIAVKNARATAGLTQSQAAKRLGWTVQRWSDLETGRHPNPRVGTLLAVAAALGCDVAFLIAKPPLDSVSDSIRRR